MTSNRHQDADIGRMGRRFADLPRSHVDPAYARSMRALMRAFWIGLFALLVVLLIVAYADKAMSNAAIMSLNHQTFRG